MAGGAIRCIIATTSLIVASQNWPLATELASSHRHLSCDMYRGIRCRCRQICYLIHLACENATSSFLHANRRPHQGPHHMEPDAASLAPAVRLENPKTSVQQPRASQEMQPHCCTNLRNRRGQSSERGPEKQLEAETQNMPDC